MGFDRERTEGGCAAAIPRLEDLQSPRELDAASLEELEGVAERIREFLIESTSRTGGHIGANLGTVELTLALHRVFDSPRDRIVFDTGHQGYTHKLLTGRAGAFPTLNTYGGLNRFLSRTESEHDPIEASHAGTSISVGLGLAVANRLRRSERRVVAVIGDGSLAEGLALEGLNHAASEPGGLVVVLNDNGFAISPGCGAIHEALQGGRARELFEALGCAYFGPVDGHDLAALVEVLERAREAERLPVVHAKTEKGRGWPPAAKHPFRQHFSFPFDPATGEPREGVAQPSYADVAAEAVAEAMAEDRRIVCITPSTLYATGLGPVFERFPERCFDPGMEEQHALSFATGLAVGGALPVVAYQSTFLQRAFDQLLHDVGFTNLPLLILAVRSGFAGYDNPTHHGIYDLAWMRGIPNLRVLYPKDRFETQRMVRDELASPTGPTVVLMPYGPVPSLDPTVLEEPPASFHRPQLVRGGEELLVLTVGNRFEAARWAVEELAEAGVDAGLVNLRQLKPLPEDALVELLEDVERVVTVEEGVLDGGVGSAVASLILDRGLACELLRIGLPCTFVEPGSSAELEQAWGLDGESLAARIRARWTELP